jgi:hypothetical protein
MAFIFLVVIINENNAISSVNERLDAAYALNLAGKKIPASAQLYEFNLDIKALYEGVPSRSSQACPAWT